MIKLQDEQNKLQTVQDKLADLDDEFNAERITHEEFKRLAREWSKFVVIECGMSIKEPTISLIDYIRVRYGKF